MEIPAVMARAPLLWSLLSLANIVLVSSGQYLKIPENYLQQIGNDSQLAMIQFLIYKPCNKEGQPEVQLQGQTQGQSQGQGLCPVQTNPCSLRINTTKTELFYTNKTYENSSDSDDLEDNSYWTLLVFSAINSSLKILPISKFIPDIILKGAFIFDLQCMTPEVTSEAETLPTATPTVTQPTVTPSPNVISPDVVLEEKWWFAIVGVLASLCVLLCVVQLCLIYKHRREGQRVRIPPIQPKGCVRYEPDMTLPPTYCHPKKSRKSDKEDWQLPPQNDNDIEGQRFQSAEQTNKQEKRTSWRQKFKSKNKKHFYVNTENNQTRNQGAGREPFPLPIQGHDLSVPMETYDEDYLPMDNHPKKSVETIDDEYLPMDNHPKKSVETVDDEYLPMDNHPKKPSPVNGCNPPLKVLPPLPRKTNDHDYLNMANHPKKSKY